MAGIIKWVTDVWKGTADAAVTGILSFLGLRPLQSIIEFVMERKLTKETFFLVLENWFVLLNFFLDLSEPLKRYIPADSEDGTPEETDALYFLPYNELDLTVPMNYHAVICQVQRLIKSIIALLSNREKLEDLTVDTLLESDRRAKKSMKEVEIRGEPGSVGEQWLFINGMCNEYFWTVLSVEKLAQRFFNYSASGERASSTVGRLSGGSTMHGTNETSASNSSRSNTTIRGIFNRSDGILWDLIECGSQRDEGPPGNTGNGQTVSEITESSREAQKLLREQLKAALEDDTKDIVMIAHSQGCLILRLVFRDFQDQERYPELHRLLGRMSSRMTVYTFGNPAYEWKCHELVRRTEHFINTLDFVARLGVLGSLEKKDAVPTSRGIYRCEACERGDVGHPKMLIWENKERRGHLFGSQYSLHIDQYKLKFPTDDADMTSELLSRNVPPQVNAVDGADASAPKEEPSSGRPRL